MFLVLKQFLNFSLKEFIFTVKLFSADRTLASFAQLYFHIVSDIYETQHLLQVSSFRKLCVTVAHMTIVKQLKVSC